MNKIVIVGGGFGGLRLARRLGKHHDVTLINDTPYFRYSPALYRAATGRRLSNTRFKLKWMLSDRPRVSLEIGRMTSIDPDNRLIQLDDDRAITYDYAALAIGSRTSYFNIDGIEDKSYGIKSYDEVIELRQHLHQTVTSDNQSDHNYVVVGAGPTGVELASALADHLRAIAKNHKLPKSDNISVWLVDAALRVLPAMSPRASKIATRRLRRAGVKLQLDTRVAAETNQTLKTDRGSIRTHTVIWTAGTADNTFYKNQTNKFDLNERNLVKVDKYLQSQPGLYVFGDNASIKYGGLAYSAIKNADFIYRDVVRQLRHQPRAAYSPSLPIQIVPTGKRSAVLQWGKFTTGGRIAAWLRSAADYVGYADVMGYIKALNIWRVSDQRDDFCKSCKLKK